MSLIRVDEKLINAATAEGQMIYQKNSFMRSLCNLMEHPEFQKVYNKNFKTWDDIIVWVMFVKVYGKIGEQFPMLNGYQKIVILQKLFGNSKSRQTICAEMLKFRKNIDTDDKLKIN